MRSCGHDIEGNVWSQAPDLLGGYESSSEDEDPHTVLSRYSYYGHKLWATDHIWLEPGKLGLMLIEGPNGHGVVVSKIDRLELYGKLPLGAMIMEHDGIPVHSLGYEALLQRIREAGRPLKLTFATPMAAMDDEVASAI